MLLFYVVLALFFRSGSTEAAFHLRSRPLKPFTSSWQQRDKSMRMLSWHPVSQSARGSQSLQRTMKTTVSLLSVDSFKSSTSLYYRNDKSIEDVTADLADDDKMMLDIPFFVSTGVDDAIAKLKLSRHHTLSPQDTEPPSLFVADNETTEVMNDESDALMSTTAIEAAPILKPKQRATLSRSYKQHMAVFEGGQPFFSLSNIEYGVAPERIANAAVTGAALSAWVLCSTILTTTMNPYSPTTSVFDMDLTASSWLLAVPIVTAYLSITRSTIGDLTRTVSDSVTNLLRLVSLLGSQVATIPVDTIQAIVTADDAKDSSSDESSNKSIPTLCGELVWYSSMAVVQRATQTLRRTEQTVQQAMDHVLQQQVDRTRRERLQRQERKQRALLQAQLYYARKPRLLPPLSVSVLSEANVEIIEDDRDDPTPPPTALSKNERIISVQSEEAAQRLLLQRQLQQRLWVATVVPEVPIFYLGEEERTDAAALPGLEEMSTILPQQHLFLLGDEERDTVTGIATTLDFKESTSLQTELVLEAKPEMVATEAGNFISPPNGRVFLLGEEEREHMRMENASLTEPFLDELIPDDISTPGVIVDPPSDVAPVQHVFLLGDEERDAVQMQHVSMTAPFLLGVAPGAVTIKPESTGILSQPVFLLGDEERDTVTDPVLITGFNDVASDNTDNVSLNERPRNTRDVENERRAIAEARRLIQKRAIELGKKRLAEVLSGVRWKKNMVYELKKQNSVVAAHSMRDRCCESLARRSLRIQEFIARNGRYGTLFSDKSLVERGAMYLLAVTTPMLVNCWIQEAVTEYAFDDADAAK